MQFIKATRGTVPSWAGGVAYPSKNTIIVKDPLYFGRGVPVEILSAHELTHLLLHKAKGENYLPRWLEEGICIYLSGESRVGSKANLGRAAAADRLMGLPRVDRVLAFSSQQADLAYSESESATRYFIDRFEWRAMRDLLKYVKTGKEFEEAFYLATGLGYEDFQIEWMDYARDRYRWVFLLEIESLIWMAIVVLFIAAMIAVFIRRRIQMRKWQDEEDEEAAEEAAEAMKDLRYRDNPPDDDDGGDDDWDDWYTPYRKPIKPK